MGMNGIVQGEHKWGEKEYSLWLGEHQHLDIGEKKKNDEAYLRS